MQWLELGLQTGKAVNSRRLLLGGNLSQSGVPAILHLVVRPALQGRCSKHRL